MGEGNEVHQADREAQILQGCLNTQHHSRNGCQSILGLLWAINDNIEKMAAITAGVKAHDIIVEMSWQAEQIREQTKRIGAAIRDCGR